MGLCAREDRNLRTMPRGRVICLVACPHDGLREAGEQHAYLLARHAHGDGLHLIELDAEDSIVRRPMNLDRDPGRSQRVRQIVCVVMRTCLWPLGPFESFGHHSTPLKLVPLAAPRTST